MNIISKVLAQGGTTDIVEDNVRVNPDFNDVEFDTLFTNVVNWIFLIAGIVAVIYLIYSGILYITAAGNPDAAKKGQQGILNAVIGLVIIGLAYAIVTAVKSILLTR